MRLRSLSDLSNAICCALQLLDKAQELMRCRSTVCCLEGIYCAVFIMSDASPCSLE